jgi:hypothetical protein
MSPSTTPTPADLEAFRNRLKRHLRPLANDLTGATARREYLLGLLRRPPRR